MRCPRPSCMVLGFGVRGWSYLFNMGDEVLPQGGLEIFWGASQLTQFIRMSLGDFIYNYHIAGNFLILRAL